MSDSDPTSTICCVTLDKADFLLQFLVSRTVCSMKPGSSNCVKGLFSLLNWLT